MIWTAEVNCSILCYLSCCCSFPRDGRLLSTVIRHVVYCCIHEGGVHFLECAFLSVCFCLAKSISFVSLGG